MLTLSCLPQIRQAVCVQLCHGSACRCPGDMKPLFFCVDIAHIKIEQYDLFCWMRSGQTHRMLEVSVALHFAIWEGWNSSGRISHYMRVNRSFLRCFSWCTSGWQHGCGTFKAQYRTFTSEACQRYRWGERLGLYTVFSCLHFRSLPKFSPLVQIAGEDCRTGCVSSCERRCQ